MAKTPKAKDSGSYIVLNGRTLDLTKSATDFSVLAPRQRVIGTIGLESAEPLASRITRAHAADPRARDEAMTAVRKASVAHHIYEVADTGEEIVIDDHIILELCQENPALLQEIVDEYKLEHTTTMGGAHVLRVTDATGRNPLKVANDLAAREGVASCAPQLLLPMVRQDAALFREQWYLTGNLLGSPEVASGADVRAPEAWSMTTGNPDIVVAVIDDGFDLGHPSFAATRLHPDGIDFEDNDPRPLPVDDDYHGTPVASIAVGGHGTAAMKGIAPNCTFLPVRIGFGPGSRPIDLLEVFRYVSQRADVVNCSFGFPPSSFDRMSPAFRRALTQLTETGGRRGKGLVIVFAAANDDAPTLLPANQNINGVLFTSGGGISAIPAGQPVFSGYPMTPGVVVVAAMSSLKRKSGYSSWGQHITVAAPSNNLHYIPAFVPPGSDPRRDRFVAHYRGLGQIASVNRPGQGAPFSPIARFDNPATPNLQENVYTREFGGTSGAAPVVAGIAALILSVNPNLTAAEVKQILMETADRDLDPALDLADDPNVQGLSGAFVGERSLFFGSGKVNAFHAVRRAQALNPAPSDDPPAATRFFGEQRPALAIPDRNPQGVSSSLTCTLVGRLGDIKVAIDITHTYRGDLRVALISPEGFIAELHKVDRSENAQNLIATFAPANQPDLANWVRGGVAVNGRWTLSVSDELFRDVGTLNAWSLELRVATV
jgi:subtilisin family serine protease/subtilisin-like proprotein convertase family protein